MRRFNFVLPSTLFIKKENVYTAHGKYFDSSEKLDAIKTIIDYALKNKALRKQLHMYVINGGHPR